ncbi:MAG: D-alanyl-D-alanine carboxypeptidase, partial [Pedobacter sp.]|nr:D-alanyl-D-alanine carboxypeptidase [Pedobacter sp.]
MFNKELCGNKYFFILVFLPLVFIYGCATNQRMASQVKKTFRESKIMGNYHVGFALADTNAEKLIYQEEADKYFTPASNMKLLTFYAALKMLPDSIPSIRYVIRGDSLIFWGNGDPSFLQSRLKGGNTYHFLQSATQKLFFAEGRYTGSFYGQGWAWDDYNDYYQAEINELPLMDNLVKVKVVNGELAVSPQLFASCFYKDSAITDTTFKITRSFNSNVFTYPNRPAPSGFT